MVLGRVRFPPIHEVKPKTKIMEQIILIDELYQKRIKLACELLGLTVELADELADELGNDSIIGAIVNVAHNKNPRLGLCNYYEFESPGDSNEYRRKYSASHIVDGMYEIVLTEEKYNHQYRWWDCHTLDEKVMSGDELVKLMESLNYTLVVMRCN
jgi:hypothetical protein